MRKHVAKVSAIYPESKLLRELSNEKAYCGLSLSNPNYTSDRLKAVLQFMATNFKKPIAITTGYLYRYHYQMLGYNYEEALNLALKKEADHLKNELLPILELESLSEVEVIKWESISKNEELILSLYEIKNFYDVCSEFKSKIDEVALNFLNAKEKYIVGSLENAKKLSVNFLLEESAVFDYLALKGYRVDVYPGIALPALRNMDKYANAPEGLKNRIAVEILIKRSGRKKKIKIAEKQEILSVED